jgi:hypothetical protein
MDELRLLGADPGHIGRLDRDMLPVGPHVAIAVHKVRSMQIAQKSAIIDETPLKQPNLLAFCIVQARLGADEKTVEFLLNLLPTCYVAMSESCFEWSLISATDQERELERTVGAVLFSEQLTDPTSAHAARAQYIATHPRGEGPASRRTSVSA